MRTTATPSVVAYLFAVAAGGGRTEILGLFNYSPDVPKDDLRPAFDVADGLFSAAGVREISFGNTCNVKAREARGDEVRTETGGG